MMTHEDAKNWTEDIFNYIKQSNSIDELQQIENKFDKQMDAVNYPKINFSINKEEIDKLIEEGILGKDLNLTNEASSKMTDPLTKLLYSLVWKNGDLKKVKHIAKGISEESAKFQDEALVFYQFGKYLKQDGEPIIDQHVIRAFKLYKCSDPENYGKCRMLKVVTKKDQSNIDDYKLWLVSDEIKPELKKESLYIYHIDKILFALGKQIKLIASKQ